MPESLTVASANAVAGQLGWIHSVTGARGAKGQQVPPELLHFLVPDLTVPLRHSFYWISCEAAPAGG
ncbi:hypothetical protein GCM10010174_12390 [Kutzneria viridogrisea]